ARAVVEPPRPFLEAALEAPDGAHRSVFVPRGPFALASLVLEPALHLLLPVLEPVGPETRLHVVLVAPLALLPAVREVVGPRSAPQLAPVPARAREMAVLVPRRLDRRPRGRAACEQREGEEPPHQDCSSTRSSKRALPFSTTSRRPVGRAVTPGIRSAAPSHSKCASVAFHGSRKGRGRPSRAATLRDSSSGPRDQPEFTFRTSSHIESRSPSAVETTTSATARPPENSRPAPAASVRKPDAVGIGSKRPRTEP